MATLSYVSISMFVGVKTSRAIELIRSMNLLLLIFLPIHLLYNTSTSLFLRITFWPPLALLTLTRVAFLSSHAVSKTI
jgi:hypothetical protein